MKIVEKDSTIAKATAAKPGVSSAINSKKCFNPGIYLNNFSFALLKDVPYPKFERIYSGKLCRTKNIYPKLTDIPSATQQLEKITKLRMQTAGDYRHEIFSRAQFSLSF